MKIRQGNDCDVLELKRLWKECFHDEDDYISFYFNRKFRADHTAILEIDGKIAGMIHLLPCFLNKKKAFYWYAACMDESFRGKGLFRSFCQEVYKETKLKGYFNACLPVRGLWDFYKSIGLENSFYVRKINYKRGEKNRQNAVITNCSTRRLFQNQEKRSGLTWDFDAVEYAFDENVFCDGGAIRIWYQDQDFAAMVVKNGDSVKLVNSDITAEVFLELGEDLAHYLNANEITLFTANADMHGETIPSGLCDDPELSVDSYLFFDLS